MYKNIIQKIVVAAVIFCNNKILLLQRSAIEKVFPNLWELPSGKKEPFETTASALKREIKEETSLLFKKAHIFSTFDYQIEKENEIRDTTQINFIVELQKNQKVVPSTEHQSYVWISLAEIDQYEITTATKKTIREAFKLKRKGAISRA
jgi:8-oxo-dGTP diphosphatase